MRRRSNKVSNTGAEDDEATQGVDLNGDEMKSAVMMSLYTRLVAASKGVQIGRYAPADIRRMLIVRRDDEDDTTTAEATGKDPLGSILVSGINDALDTTRTGTKAGYIRLDVRSGSSKRRAAPTTPIIDLTPWISVSNMCFQPGATAPKNASIMIAYDVRTSKVAGFLSMCRHYKGPDLEKYPELEDAATRMRSELYTEAAVFDELQAREGPASVTSYMLIDVVFALKKKPDAASGPTGVGGLLVLSAIAAALRMRAQRPQGIMAVAVTDKSAAFFRSIGFSRIVVSGDGDETGVWACKFSDASLARINESIGLSTEMMTKVCVRRGVRNTNARMARC
jgi:hypothetical protein